MLTPPRTRELSTPDALRRLGTIGFGRIVYSRWALPTIRPVNHVLDHDTLVIYANPGATMAPERQVVAYQADMLDHYTQLGWCVTITGVAEEITDQHVLTEYRTRIHHRLAGADHRLVRIRPEIVIGLEYLDPAPQLTSDNHVAPLP
ncbi:pyridoxamine 5'-phosphate oxidase family protein [Nocardia seriolae]|uniref:Pyridoxamine 5'-phosphate oxidase family protein n=1 Tax=Nocardia seriolae TaxID=37332 RepID=A0ABC8AUD9_9NOCA|nr:pyridoxamine 5'-phosphate oxidase family protein [Nocardia seriolae]APA97764.1 uncharacterized protein NS506_03715 [Nocardia seriolae]OJF79794.1 hypothetical protein NS14008_12055 [Nocardia seriolae]PSK27488.1 pyridoxamine 5'-phosphate oxidase family protein [Nocardia seriolae]QOW36271.1 pyridoxamine 5'-phosphate oxidase family protein [Nocardia seriolae]QUN16222.1 pyridoxamine 5'-phosphate oxidase family protein [Nocardia seriolae]